MRGVKIRRVVELREPVSRDSWLTAAVLFTFSAAVLAAGMLSPRIGIGWFLAVVTGGTALLLSWLSRAWGYCCPACGVRFQLSLLGQFTAINMGNERRIRCPRCYKRSWMKMMRVVRPPAPRASSR